MDFVCHTDRGVLREQQRKTLLKELELRDKAERLRTQRVLLERNLLSVTDRQSQLQAKEDRLSNLQQSLVNRQMELQQSLLVLGQQEKVVRQSEEMLRSRLAEAKRNKEKSAGIRDAVRTRLETAEDLYAELLTEEQELKSRQTLLNRNEKTLAVARSELAVKAERVGEKWTLFQQHISDLEVERRSQGLQRLRAMLASREAQLREEIKVFEERNLQLQALNGELEKEQSALVEMKADICTQCNLIEDKREKLQTAMQRYEELKAAIGKAQELRADTILTTQAKELELHELKTTNRAVADSLASLSAEQQSKKRQSAESKENLVKLQSALSSRAAVIKEKAKEVQCRREDVKKLEADVLKMEELEGRMDGKIRRMRDSEEDWKRAHSSELQTIKEYMLRIEQKEQRLARRSPVKGKNKSLQ